MKEIIVLLLLFCMPYFTQAQKPINVFSLETGIGLHNLNYTLKNGSSSANSGLMANLKFAHFLTSLWGIETGVGLKSYKSSSTINLTEKTPSFDSDGDPYEYRAVFHNWSEIQGSTQLEIPIEGVFRYMFNTKVGLLTKLGVSVSIPLSTKYETIDGDMTTSGYYSQWNIELTNLPQHGFSTVTASQVGEYELKSSFSAIFELEGIYQLSNKIAISTGIYGSHSINGIYSTVSNTIQQVQGNYEGILQSNQLLEMRPFSVGLKVGLKLAI